jgi:hypothetical protein
MSCHDGEWQLRARSDKWRFDDYITSYASARGEFAGIPKVNPLKEAVL